MLKKSLYYLKQASRHWYKKFDGCMQKMAIRSAMLTIVSTLKLESSDIILLYVDDMLVAGPNMNEIQKLRKQLPGEFEMNDLMSY